MGKAIGIDLGTTNSVMAISGNDGVEVLATSMGKEHTASVVCYRPGKAEEEGEYIVGAAAQNIANMYPRTTVRSVKRLMGRLYRDERVQETKDRVHYAIVPAPEAKQDKGVYIDFGREKLSPVNISAKILRKIKEDARQALGEEVTHAVITVPAYFEERQRTATRKAGEEAGFIVQRIIDEPTAAAIAYGAKSARGEGKRILVYDLGGGTFDVSLIKLLDDQYVVDKIQGDNWLGGDDLDYELMEIVLRSLQEKHDIQALRKDAFFMEELKKVCEETKCNLSGSKHADVQGFCRTSGGDAVPLSLTISRETFERAIKPYIERTMDALERALGIAGIDAASIDEVLLVGGSTSVPAVREAVIKKFGDKKVKRGLNPMFCVAQGAARLAADSAILCPQCNKTTPDLEARACPHCGASWTSEQAVQLTPKLALSHATAMDLGIQAVDGENTHAFAVIIGESTPYPLREPVTRPFRTAEANQKVIRIPVYEGAGRNVTDYEVRKQGEIVIEVEKEFGKQEGLPLNHLINISFDYDKDRLLTVIIEVEGIAKKIRHQLEHKDVSLEGLNFGEDEEYESGPDEQADEVLRKEESGDELRLLLKREVRQLQAFLLRHRSLLQPSQIAEMEDLIRRGKRLILEEAFDNQRAETLLEFILESMTGSGTAYIVEHVDNMCHQAITAETREKLKLGKNALLDEVKSHGEGSPRFHEIMDDLGENIREATAALNVAGVETIAGHGGLVKQEKP